MDIRYILTGILAALFCLLILIQVVTWLSRRRRDQAARTYLAQHLLPGRSYEIDSPEHNALIVAAIHKINERIAAEGKRIPERMAIDIIKQTRDRE